MSASPRNAAKPNRLAAQTSPYLLQHQFNPVDWFAWGEEAFAEARRRDVPIFLSVGYSTCYWCHVMERESFENDAIAAIMNERFVCIKVDREERPDVDDIYMAAVQAFSGHGGWPMSVFLEPKTLRPFWAGTYFPAEPRPGMGVPAFPQILTALSEAWKTHRDEIDKQAEDLADAVRERVVNAEEGGAVRVGEEQVTGAVMQLLRMHDGVHGGFGGAPKFPQPVFLDLLLATRQAAGDEETRGAIDHALRHTLTKMALGGTFDQVGGGFHRYSVDQRWLVPHFEKMLYDSGALMEVYARAFVQHGDPLFDRVARRIGEYVLREMVAPEGAFFTAQDAEVNHREGQNYLWTRDQLRETLGEKDGEWAAHLYGVDEGPNFRDPHHPEDAPANVLFVSERALAEVGADPWTEETFLHRLDGVNERLYRERAKRNQPGTDTKIIAGWNGLMIAGLARAGLVLKEPRFASAAARAAEFVLREMRASDGGLLRTFAQGRAAIDAVLEDYALLIHGLLELNSAGADAEGRFVGAAQELAEQTEARFGDHRGGFFDTLADRPDLFVRTRSVYDGAIPSGSSVMINNLVDLALVTRERAFAHKAARALAGVSAYLAQTPLGAANATRGLLRLMMLDRAALDEAFAGAAGAPIAPDEHPHNDHTPVEILSAVESVSLPPPPDQPIGIIVKVRIEPDYHVNAAIPGDDSLVPFKVHIVHGSGVAVYADYPPGEAYGRNGEIRIYRGEFDLSIVLEREGEWKGTPLIAVTYQACTDTACLTARTVELDVEIDRG